MKTKEVVLTLPPGNQIDLESEFTDFMLNKAKEDPNFPLENPWGEYYVVQGKILHGIQWSYVGVEQFGGGPWVYDEDYSPDNIDFEVDCSWHEDENYA